MVDKTLKRCPKCTRELTLSHFGKNRCRKDGKNVYCKECSKVIGVERKDKVKEYNKKRWIKLKGNSDNLNKERKRIREYARVYRLTSKRKDYEKQYCEKNVAKFKEYREEHKKDKQLYDKAYVLKNRKKINKDLKERRAKDPFFRLRCYMSTRISTCLKKHGGSKKGSSVFKKLGYSFEDLKTHIEKLFDANMTWENYGAYWVIDHIVPRVAFKYKDMDDPAFKECWNLSNLRPLESTLNLKKNSFLNGVDYKKKRRARTQEDRWIIEQSI